MGDKVMALLCLASLSWLVGLLVREPTPVLAGLTVWVAGLWVCALRWSK